jgi:hypothetical protein
VTEPHHGVGERVADAARHVAEALDRDFASLATPTPAEAIAETAADAAGASDAELAATPPDALPVDIPVEHIREPNPDEGEARI